MHLEPTIYSIATVRITFYALVPSSSARQQVSPLFTPKCDFKCTQPTRNPVAHTSHEDYHSSLLFSLNLLFSLHRRSPFTAFSSHAMRMTFKEQQLHKWSPLAGLPIIRLTTIPRSTSSYTIMLVVGGHPEGSEGVPELSRTPYVCTRPYAKPTIVQFFCTRGPATTHTYLGVSRTPSFCGSRGTPADMVTTSVGLEREDRWMAMIHRLLVTLNLGTVA